MGMIFLPEETTTDFRNSLISELLKLDLFNIHAENEKQRMKQIQQSFFSRGSFNEKAEKRMV